MSDSKEIDVIRAQAKQKALKVIESNPGCVSYVNREDLDTQSLFVPVVTRINPAKDDFYDPIPKVGIMMKPHLVNLVREKAGIEITRTETTKRDKYVWVTHVWGQRRQPDGTMLPDDASYEWDAELRSELDCLNQPEKYGSDIAKRKHLLETAKSGEARCVTGAHHALIHKLAHIPRAFKTPEELMRGMIVSRVDRNVDGLLSIPGMANAALEMAIGAKTALYGPASAEPRAQIGYSEPVEHAQAATAVFDDEPASSDPFGATTDPEAEAVYQSLIDYTEKYGNKIPPNGRQQITEALASKDREHMQKVLERIKMWESSLGGAA